MSKYFFVIRSYNDIDHFTPLIDYMCENKYNKIYLFSSEPLELILPNENIEYLNKEYGIKPNPRNWAQFAKTHKKLLEELHIPADVLVVYSKKRAGKRLKK